MSFKVIHFAISHRPTKGGISSYNIAGLISEVSEEVATQIAKNCRRQQHRSHLRSPPRGTPASIRIVCTLYFQKLESLAYIFVAACRLWVYLHSNLCNELQKTHLFCTSTRVRFGRSRSFRVIELQGRRFWYQSKARIRLPISR